MEFSLWIRFFFFKNSAKFAYKLGQSISRLVLSFFSYYSSTNVNCRTDKSPTFLSLFAKFSHLSILTAPTSPHILPNLFPFLYQGFFCPPPFKAKLFLISRFSTENFLYTYVPIFEAWRVYTFRPPFFRISVTETVKYRSKR